MTARLSRVERARMPLARDVVRAVAVEHGVCIRPVPVRQTDTVTGETTVVDVPCGATFASKCPPCAERARRLRMVQCQQGWHLDHEPDLTADDPTARQRKLMADRAGLVEVRDLVAESGGDVGLVDEAIVECDQQIADAGVRGSIAADAKARRVRSTRRRQDAADLPRRKIATSTLGRVFDGRDGKAFRPSLFLTLTLDSYGRVRQDGTPVDPDRYDYVRAARDAVHFAKLVDRFVQNLRRFVGWEVQYFAAVEPQRRLAPHLHMAIRGTVSRAELRQVVAATYAQVWWPPCDVPVYDGDRLPVFDEDTGQYLDPDTEIPLPRWDDALDDLGADPDAAPVHVVRFGPVLDVQGVLAGTPDADRCVRYLAKYLTKSVHECHTPDTDPQRAHVARLVDALRYEPCSPTCANWLRYGVQPKNPRPNLRPGYCTGKAHRAEHLGYAGRRVLVSRKWSAKNLADHRAERRNYVLAVLARAGGEVSATVDPDRYAWEPATSNDPDVAPLAHRLLRSVAERVRWRHQYDAAKAASELSATDAA